jgi:hypothetical protein
VQNLREENRQLRHIIDEEAKDSGRVILELSASQALLAMQSEALEDIARGRLQGPANFEQYAVRVAKKALSATAETIPAWEEAAATMCVSNYGAYGSGELCAKDLRAKASELRAHPVESDLDQAMRYK